MVILIAMEIPVCRADGLDKKCYKNEFHITISCSVLYCKNVLEVEMTNYEKMLAGVIYDPSDPEIMNEQYPFLDKLWEFNQLKPTDHEKKAAYMKEVFAECGENVYIELPLRGNGFGVYGCRK